MTFVKNLKYPDSYKSSPTKQMYWIIKYEYSYASIAVTSIIYQIAEKVKHRKKFKKSCEIVKYQLSRFLKGVHFLV